jgi:uncharacterized protein (TIGR02246 family)
MKLFSSAVLILVALALVACAPATEEVVVEEPDTTEADIAAIREVVATYHDTMEAEDLDAHMATYADDCELHANGEPVAVGKEEIRRVGARNFRQFDWDFEFSSEEVDAVGDLGYYLGINTVTQPDEDGETRTYHGSTMVILRRQADGAWKITRYMWNNRPPAEE